MNNDAYGRTVVFSTDGTTDTYLVGGAVSFEFPAGTSQAVVYLAFAKQLNAAKFQQAVQDFGDLHYPVRTVQQFQAVWAVANLPVNVLLVNRRAYILQLFTWTSAVISFATTYVIALNAMSDPAVVAATSGDFTQIPADPMVTPGAALLINS